MVDPDGRPQVTRPNSNEPVFLEDILQPLWIYLRNSGIHHSFLPMNDHHRIRRIIRYTSTVSIVLLILTFNFFQLTQLIIQTANRKNIADISVNVVLTSVSLMGVLFSYQFYVRHDQLAKFFEDWKQFEISIPSNCNTGRREFFSRILVAVFTLIYVYPIFCFYDNLTHPNKPIFFSYFEIFQEIFGLQFLALINAVSLLFIQIFYLLSESIPPLFFYQASFVIENLGKELQNICLSLRKQHLVHLRNENHYLLIWKKYESIQRLVNRANELFGITMVFNQFLFFCCTCICIYQAVTLSLEDLLLDPLFFADIFVSIVRNVVCYRLFSRLYLSWVELKRIVATLLSEEWYLLPQNHRDYLTTFLIRVNSEGLAANPLNLYTIDPTSLLRLLGMHVSYIILLLTS